MTITTGEIKHLAKLSKLALSESEIEHYRGDLENILGFLESLQSPNEQQIAQKSDSKVQLFTEQESYTDPTSLLQNTKHPITHHTITIKTSLTH